MTFFVTFTFVKKLAVFLLLLAPVPVAGQSDVIGKWKSVDENSGEPKSIVELTERKGKLFGKILRIFPKPGEDPDPTCEKCPDTRLHQKIVGMEIITDMALDGDAWSGGSILDPEAGKIYSCKLWIENNSLKVRGYSWPFYRTQTWERVP